MTAPTCATCPIIRRFFCIFACSSVNHELAKIEDVLSKEGK